MQSNPVTCRLLDTLPALQLPSSIGPVRRPKPCGITSTATRRTTVESECSTEPLEPRPKPCAAAT
jgi:hypothetical protein